METRKKLVIGALVLLAVIAAGWYLYDNYGRPVPDNSVYSGRAFSFNYPRTYELKEYTSGAVSVGEEGTETYNPQVEVVRYMSDPDTALPPSYDAFIKRQAQNLCAADGPTESISCSNAQTEPFVTASGVAGQKLSLTLTRKNLQTGTTTSSTYAPLYVFNKTDAPTAEDPLRYQAIFVYPALPSIVDGGFVPALMDQIVNSLVVPNGVSTVGQPAA